MTTNQTFNVTINSTKVEERAVVLPVVAPTPKAAIDTAFEAYRKRYNLPASFSLMGSYGGIAVRQHKVGDKFTPLVAA